jgi:hypothetical protein
MGTPSAIGVMHGNKCKAVYCNFDGHLTGVGKMLHEHYQDSAKANHLVALGDLSYVAPSVVPATETHCFDTPERGVCVFYGRDRGEEGCEFDVFQSEEELFDGFCVEYFYVMHDGVWLFSNGRDGWIPLELALDPTVKVHESAQLFLEIS